jgi:hypothetical protein
MSRAGVSDALIINHIRAHGAARPLQPGDLIRLQQDGVSPAVAQTLQTAPVLAAAAPVPFGPGPAPVVVVPGPIYGPPWPPPPPRRWHRRY